MPPISHHNGTCIDGGGDATLSVRLPAGAGVDFAWPPLPPAGSDAYRFALERVLVVLAPGCVVSAGLTANADDGPGTRRSLWVGRLAELHAPPSLETCGCGAAIFLAGSGGLTGDNLRFMRHLAARGYSAVAPDPMASPAGGGVVGAYPRHRDLVPRLSDSLKGRDTYWCADEVYRSGCRPAHEGGPYAGCFSSDSDNIVYDPAGWAAYYERVYSMRARELDFLLDSFGPTFGTPARLFLHGNSEGAMVASRYSHPKLRELHLAGRLLTAWSCEYNYFVSCAAHAQLAAPSVPILNVVSVHDEFFAASASIAARVAASPSGYGVPPTGSCASQMRAQGVRGASIRLDQPYHDNLEQGGSLYRMAADRFLRNPVRAGARWSVGARARVKTCESVRKRARVGASARPGRKRERALPPPAHTRTSTALHPHASSAPHERSRVIAGACV